MMGACHGCLVVRRDAETTVIGCNAELNEIKIILISFWPINALGSLRRLRLRVHIAIVLN
jgi:hypothetical protein